MTNQNEPVNPFDLSRRLEVWLLEDEVRQRHGLPRPVKKIITSSHVSPASGISKHSSRSSPGEILQARALPRQSFHPSYDPTLLNRSLAYHRDQNNRLSGLPTQKRKSGLPPTAQNSSLQLQALPVPRPGKQARVKVDSANGSLERDEAEIHASIERHSNANLLSIKTGNAPKRQTLTANSNYSDGSEHLTSPPFQGSGSLLSPSSTLYGSHLSLADRSSRNTLNTESSAALRSAGLESHLSLDYASSKSGLSSADDLIRRTPHPVSNSAINPSVAARRERIVGRMDLRTGKYILETVIDSPGSSAKSPRSSSTPKSDQSGTPISAVSRSHSNLDDVNTDHESVEPQEEKVVVVAGEERRANWAQTDDASAAAKESFIKRLRRRTLGAVAPPTEKVDESALPTASRAQQPKPTEAAGSTKPKFTERSGGGRAPRPAPLARSHTAPSEAALPQIKEPNQQSPPRRADSGSSKEAQKAWQTLVDTSLVNGLEQSEGNQSPTKRADNLRPTFQLFPTSSASSVPTVSTVRPRSATRGGSNRVSRSHSQTRVNNFDAVDPIIVAQVNDARSRSKQVSPITDTFPRIAPIEESPVAAPVEERPAAIEAVTPSRPTTSAHNVSASTYGSRPAPQPVRSYQPSMRPLLSDAELAKMTVESRALFKQQETLLRKRLNNTAVNTALPTAIHTVVATTVGTAVHSVQHSVGSLTPMAAPSPPRTRNFPPRSTAITVPRVPKLLVRQQSDIGGPRPMPGAEVYTPTSRKVTPLRVESFPAFEEPAKPTRVSPAAPTTRQTPASLLNSTPFHEISRRKTMEKVLPPSRGARSVLIRTPQGADIRPATARSAQQHYTPAPPPKDYFNAPLNMSSNDFDASPLSADDGPGPTIEDPRYFEENVMKYNSQTPSYASKEKRGFWKKMTVRAR